jgi:prevent-host-death family protein
LFEAKTHLSRLVRQVKAGQTITLTERGRPVARVVPLPVARTLDDRIEELEGAGLVTGARTDLVDAALEPIAVRRGALRRFLASRD